MSDQSNVGIDDGPDYDIEIEADELLAELVDGSESYADDYEEKRRWWRESLDYHDEHTEARYWMLEAHGGRKAYSKAIAALQPQNSMIPSRNFRNADNTVDVRGFMAWISRLSEEAHEDSYGAYTETRQADEAETAYARILSTLRDDFGVGWPRIDDLGGVMECDLP